MSDSGRTIGDCKHGLTPERCVECLRAERDGLRAEVERLTQQLGELEDVDCQMSLDYQLLVEENSAMHLVAAENDRLRAALQRCALTFEARADHSMIGLEDHEWEAWEMARKALEGKT